MLFLQVIIVLLLIVVICQRGIKLSTIRKIKELLMSQETELQAILAALTANGEGIVTIIGMLTTLRDNNPQIADEIEAIRLEAQKQADEINAALNPTPEP